MPVFIQTASNTKYPILSNLPNVEKRLPIDTRLDMMLKRGGETSNDERS